MMEVYIVTSGEYSSYCIEAVFTDRKQAELYVATHSRDYMVCEIETWKCDEQRFDAAARPKNRWKAIVTKRGTFERCKVSYVTLTEMEDAIIDYGNEVYVHVTLDQDIKENTAKKIILDKLAEYKYRRYVEMER